jgi:ribosome-associated translation inhibitor RaiA
MSVPVTLTFHHLPRSGRLEACARDIGSRLQSLHHRMTSCHIVFEGSGGPGVSGSYQVKIHVSVPGAQIHAESVLAEAGSPLQSAYENAKRQLEKLKRMQS